MTIVTRWKLSWRLKTSPIRLQKTYWMLWEVPLPTGSFSWEMCSSFSWRSQNYCSYLCSSLICWLCLGLMLKIHPLERPNIVDILERLQDISMAKNVSPKEPVAALVSAAASSSLVSGAGERAGMFWLYACGNTYICMYLMKRFSLKCVYAFWGLGGLILGTLISVLFCCFVLFISFSYRL